VHNAVSEALERLLFFRFLGENNYQIPINLVEASADPDLYRLCLDIQFPEFINKYLKYRQSVKEGNTLLERL